MTKEELKDRISMALKDPILQQGFEIICKENAELKGKLKTAYRKGMRHMAKALKDYDRTDGAWTDYFEHTVDKVLQREQLDFEEYGTLAEQLTKAKEIIKMLHSDCYSIAECEDTNLGLWEDDLAKAEQFLKEE